MSVAETITVTPAWAIGSVTAVIKAVLGLGRTVEVDDDFQTCLSRPVDCGIDIRSRSLRIWAPRVHVAPVSDRNAHQVEAGVLDLPEVVERRKAVPVGFEDVDTGLLSELLAQSPLIDDGPFCCAVTLEDRRRNEPGGL
jgi:hypothetical protein